MLNQRIVGLRSRWRARGQIGDAEALGEDDPVPVGDCQREPGNPAAVQELLSDAAGLGGRGAGHLISPVPVTRGHGVLRGQEPRWILAQIGPYLGHFTPRSIQTDCAR